MSLNNYTKIEVDEFTRRKVLAALKFLEEGSALCIKCHLPPRYGDSHYYAVCGDCRQQCSHAAAFTGYVITSNGARQVKRRCLNCGAGPSLAGRAAKGSEYLDICLGDNRDSTVCEHCGSLNGVELHHYAPWNTFDDADKWATGYLCRPCHHLWHRTMNGYLWNRSRKQRPMTDDEAIRRLIEITGPQTVLSQALKEADLT